LRVRVYFCKEPEVEILAARGKISRQALDTIYDLVWEAEFKNIITPGKIWLKFQEELKPFGIALKQKRSHEKMSASDIIQIDTEYYMVMQTGAREIKLD